MAPEIYLDPWEAYDALRPLALFVVSVTLYGVFVFHFYRFLARKDIFQLDLEKYNEAKHPLLRKTVSVAFYIFKSLLLFPLFVTFWFLVMAGLLLLMGRNQSIDGIMLAAIGVVAAIRICAYYNGALATDIAKILPFALLGIMLIDNSLIRIPQSTDSIQQAAMRLETMIYYLAGVVALEFTLRILTAILGLIRRSAARDKPAAEPKAAEPARAATDKAEQPRKVEQPRAVPPTPVPTYAQRPAYGAERAAGMGASPAYGRAQPGAATASLSQAGRAPGGPPSPGDIPAFLGTGPSSGKTLHDSPRSRPFPYDVGRPSS